MSSFGIKNIKTKYLQEFIDNCQKERIEAIYNAEYKYIKEIIWDDEKNNQYGTTREGYENFKQDNNGSISHSHEIYLRENKDIKTKETLGYLIESKRTSNDNYNIMYDNFKKAKEKFIEMLEVEDTEAFEYWLESYTSIYLAKANEIINSIKTLDNILIKYNEDKEFKRFIDKIKQI